MTGRAAFARTLRALDADRFRASEFALLLGAILLAAWLWWFFTPSIISTMPEIVALNWHPSTHRVALVNPPPDLFAKLHKGALVQLHLDDRTVRAHVTNWALWKLPYDSSIVHLEFPDTLQPPLPTHATIEIASTPASLVLRTL